MMPAYAADDPDTAATRWKTTPKDKPAMGAAGLDSRGRPSCIVPIVSLNVAVLVHSFLNT